LSVAYAPVKLIRWAYRSTQAYGRLFIKLYHRVAVTHIKTEINEKWEKYTHCVIEKPNQL